MWGDDTSQSASDRSSVAGIAYTSSACITDFKISLSEDTGGFFNIYVIAHEIGHNLGSAHDGSGNLCLSSDSFIMSPIVSFNNIQNTQKFSSCSIEYFKNYILAADG